MTTHRRDGNDSPFAAWVRSHPKLDSVKQRLSVSDADYWFHQYRAHRDKVGERLIDSIMLVELKTYLADVPFSQRDTLRLVNEGLRRSFINSSGNVKTMRMTFGSEVRQVRMYGVFLLRLSGSAPNDSEQIIWHGRQVNEEKLVEILRFDRDPISLRLRSDRRHHTPDRRIRGFFDGVGDAA